MLSPSVAGLGFGIGVGVGNPDGVIAGGVVYGLGQMEAIMPADVNDIGGFARLTTPISLLYRMLLGSAFANIGDCARADIPAAPAPDHSVAVVVPELTIVKSAPGWAYLLKFVARHKPGVPGIAVIQVLLALLP